MSSNPNHPPLKHHPLPPLPYPISLFAHYQLWRNHYSPPPHLLPSKRILTRLAKQPNAHLQYVANDAGKVVFSFLVRGSWIRPGEEGEAEVLGCFAHIWENV